jgi:hypothetical protein
MLSLCCWSAEQPATLHFRIENDLVLASISRMSSVLGNGKKSSFITVFICQLCTQEWRSPFFILSCLSASRPPQPTWLAGIYERADRADIMANCSSPLTSITPHCENALKFNDYLLQLLGFLALRSSLALDTTSCSWSQSPRIPVVWSSKPWFICDGPYWYGSTSQWENLWICTISGRRCCWIVTWLWSYRQ